jgi:hypothetical protein
VGERQLYIENDFTKVWVSTSFVGISNPYGIARGKYEGFEGLFLSTYKPSKIFFMRTDNGCEAAGSCSLVGLIDSGFSGVLDGPFSSATVSDPSRMVYVERGGRRILFVMDRANGLIRCLDLDNKVVSTLRRAPGGSALAVSGSQLVDNQPELDIKVYGEFLYVSDTSSVYNITGTDGTLLGALTSAVMTRYSALKQWQILNDFERTSTRKVYVTSITINPVLESMYVSYTYQRHAIVEVKLRASSPSDVRIVTYDNKLWSPVTTVPRPANGNILNTPPAGFAWVTFPMHLHYDATDDVLYWTEVYAHFSTGTTLGALGAVAVRRLQFATNEVDYFAGNVGTIRSTYGKVTGYQDGPADTAQFSYPVSMLFVSSTASVDGGPKLYVVDTQNAAVRMVQRETNTPVPSAAPTVSSAPTAPTFQPSADPSAEPSMAPSAAPTAATAPPTISMAPTKFVAPTSAPTVFNGECLALNVQDSFGDGWSGAYVRADLPGSSVRTYTPSTSFPETFKVCGSFDRPETAGLYSFSISSDAPNEWELRWSVTVPNSGLTYYGDAETSMVFEFNEDGFVFVVADKTPPGNIKCEPCRSTSESKDEVVVNLHNDGRKSYFDETTGGTSFYIMDAPRNRLLEHGSVCGPAVKHQKCGALLPDGDYYFRLGGALSTNRDDLWWTFCNQRGHAMQELSFAIIDGDCVPGALRDASLLLSTETKTQLSLSGNILLEKVTGPSLANRDKYAIEDALKGLLLSEAGIVAQDVVVSSACASANGDFCSSVPKRGPSVITQGTSTWDVSISVLLVAEANGADGTKHAQVMKLVDKVKRAITDGVVHNKLTHSMSACSRASLAKAEVHREVPFRLVHLNYISTSAPTMEPTVAYPVSAGGLSLSSSVGLGSSSAERSRNQFLMLLFVFGIPAVVAIAFLTARRFSNGASDAERAVEEGEVKVSKGSWRDAVFNEAVSSSQSAVTSASPMSSDRLSKMAGSSQRGRFRVDEGLTHYDTMSSRDAPTDDIAF